MPQNPPITPLELPEGDPLKRVWEVVNHNANLILIDGSVDGQGLLSYTTKNGEQISVDLSAVFLTRKEYSDSDPDNGRPASETGSGPIAIISEAEVKDAANPDDVKAMTMAKTLILLGDMGLPKFDVGAAEKGDMLIFDGERYVPGTLEDQLIAALANPSAGLQKVICAVVAKCPTSGTGSGGNTIPTTPADPVSVFTTVHYIFVDDVPAATDPQYDYILGSDRKYGGTFDMLTDTTLSWWALKLGVGPVNVDVKYRKKGSLSPLADLALNLSPNFDRPDVVAAPGINTPGGSFCGRQLDVPTALRTGEEMEVHVFVAGTTVELKSSPRYITLQAQNQPKAGVYQLVGDNVDEGGLAKQQTLQQQWTDGQWHNVAARNWVVKDSQNNAITGVGIPGGLLKADANTVNQTTFVQIGCQPVDSDQFVSATRQVIDKGCSRPAGLTTFTACYAIAPKNGNAHRFDTLDQANNEMGVYYDDPADYVPAQFPFQAQSLAVGQDVYNRADTTSCERVDDGKFYLSDSANGNTIKAAGRFAGGKIVEIKATSYQTPAPTPDTSWATLTDPFDQANPNYLQSNGTVWNWANGMVCVNVNNMVRGDTGALILDVDADRILVLLSVGARDVTDPRYGVGLKYTRELETGGPGKGGYNLLLTRNNNTNLVQFLFDHIAFGPSYPYEWQPNTRYYVAMRYIAIDSGTARLDGKVWKESEIEPTAWPYTWNVSPRTGQAAIVGGSNYPGAGNVAAGCVDQVWLQTAHVAPRLINVALGKPVTAPANTLNGGFDPRFVTDNTDAAYSTDCLLETSPVSVVTDFGGLARPEQVQLKPRPDFPNAMPVDFTVDGSLDGKAWTTLLTIANLARGAAELTYNLPSANGVFGQFRYGRLRATRLGRAEATDCIRLQIGEMRWLAPQLDALPAEQKTTILQIARAFIGASGSNGAAQRDLLYFVKNGVSPQANATGIAPTWGFKNLTTGSPDSLASKSEMYSIADFIASGGNSSWLSVLNQAKAQGFEWFTYANAASAGQSVRFRFGGNVSETAYREFDFIVPADGTTLNLETIFPV